MLSKLTFGTKFPDATMLEKEKNCCHDTNIVYTRNSISLMKNGKKKIVRLQITSIILPASFMLLGF